jgi:long-chain acyl-CoA synthetase
MPYAAAEAAVCDSVRLTYAELTERTGAVAAAVRDLGLAPGDRVALLAANCHRYLELLLAVPGAGMVPVPLNTRLSPAEMRHVLTHSGTRVLVTDRDVGSLVNLGEHVVTIPDGYEALVDAGRRLAGQVPAQPSENDLAVLSS